MPVLKLAPQKNICAHKENLMQPKKILGAFGEIRPELCHRNDLNTWTGMLGAFLLSVLGRGISASVAQLFDENKKTACDFQCCDGLF